MPVTCLDIVTDALQEIGVLNAVDPPSGEDGALALFRFNKLLDKLNAERNSVYAELFSTFTITPSLNPHTIGPTGTWVTTQCPQSIESLTVIDGTAYRTINIRDAPWYASLSIPTQTAALPTDVWYEPAWPDGNLYFYPVPTGANTVRLGSRVVLAALTLASTFTLPPGYQDFLTLDLAVDLAGPFRVPLSPDTRQRADTARARVERANIRVPKLATVDAGMPCSSSGSAWDYTRGY